MLHLKILSYIYSTFGPTFFKKKELTRNAHNANFRIVYLNQPPKSFKIKNRFEMLAQVTSLFTTNQNNYDDIELFNFRAVNHQTVTLWR